MERCVHKHLFNYIQDNKLFTPFLRLISYYIPTISSVRLLILGKKWELSFAISAKHLTESGIGGFYISYLGLAFLSMLLNGALVIYQIGGSVLFWAEPSQIGRPYMQGSRNELYWDHFSFLSLSMTLSKIWALLSASLPTTPVCISLWKTFKLQLVFWI